ncbi:MAG: 3-dehydroquinate synthase, partial [Deferribacterales bacterium]|nr:3-dehydroquinate synthase [Deferribacterales bacterium]
GGGITGDTAAFAAAVYMRGIKVVQMPTTLLSMVDSAVGGKTGVNFCGVKNNIGAFHQPSRVIIDTDFLKTLSDSEFLNGFAESLKIAAVADMDFFDYLKNNKEHIIKRDAAVMENVIYRSCALKAAIVEADEKESGKRKLLNFGHTIAHAIEADSHHKIHHGYAVAMGMMYETKYALQKGIADEKVFNEIKNILLSYGYPLEYNPESRNVFMNALAKDKKAAKSGISLALTGSGMVGKIIDGVTVEELGALFF